MTRGSKERARNHPVCEFLQLKRLSSQSRITVWPGMGTGSQLELIPSVPSSNSEPTGANYVQHSAYYASIIHLGTYYTLNYATITPEARSLFCWSTNSTVAYAVCCQEKWLRLLSLEYKSSSILLNKYTSLRGTCIGCLS